MSRSLVDPVVDVVDSVGEPSLGEVFGLLCELLERVEVLEGLLREVVGG